MITLISFILVIIGAINWLFVGVFSLDLVAAIFGTAASIGSRIVYIIVGIAALWLVIQAIRHKGRLNMMNDDMDIVPNTMLSGKSRSKTSD